MITNTLKILMLEDSDIDAEVIQRLVSKSGLQCEFKVMMTKPAFEKALQEFKPDVILSDNAMPQFSASEALEVVKEKKLHVPFILVTGTVSEEFAAGIIKAGADDYLLKDRLARLPAAIEAALKQKQNDKEKKEAAERLLHSEEKYRSMTERVTDGFVALDKNWIYTYVNKQAGEILRRNPEELVGKNIWAEFPESADQPFYKGYRKALDEQQYIHFEEYYPPFDLWLENHIYPSPDGVSVFFRDITERKKIQEKIKISEERYSLLIQRMSDGFISLDKDWNYTYLNNKAAEIIKRNPADIIGKNFWVLFPDLAGTEIYKLFHDAMQTQQPMHNIDYYAPLNSWQENFIYPSENGISVFIRDITEKKKAEEKIIKANRLYFFISQINQMIVRTTDEKTLFSELCNIAVAVGKFKMAWVGIIDDKTKKLVPVTHAGDEHQYLSVIEQISVEDNAAGSGPVGTSFRDECYIVCNDIESDAIMAPWKKDALARHYRSCMALPVKKPGKVIGSFAVYSSEKNFFDAEEITLLQEAASDIAFALEIFEKEDQRQKAEAAVIKSEQRYHTLTDISPVGIFHTDAAGGTTYVNPRWCEISGLPFERGLGYGWLDAVHEEDKEALINGWKKATVAQQFSSSEYRYVSPDGSIAWVIG